MWIKICGMTSEAGGAAAAASSVPMRSASCSRPSARQLEPAQAAQLAHGARGRVAVHRGDAASARRRRSMQICANSKPDCCRPISDDLRELQIAGAPDGAAGACAAARKIPNPLPPRMLFEGPRSGTGDWRRTGAQAAQLARRTRVDSGRRTDAAQCGRGHRGRAARSAWMCPAASRPRPGSKDPRKIDEFVQAARAAVCRYRT